MDINILEPIKKEIFEFENSKKTVSDNNYSTDGNQNNYIKRMTEKEELKKLADIYFKFTNNTSDSLKQIRDSNQLKEQTNRIFNTKTIMQTYLINIILIKIHIF